MDKSKSGKSRSSTANGSGKAKRGGSFQILNEPATNGRTEGGAHKYEVTHGTPPAYEELGQLPESYGETGIFLIARDPKWLFTYWDIAPDAEAQAGRYFLKVFFENGNAQSTIQIHRDAKNWYIPAPAASAAYYVEIGCYKKGKWESLARSNTATTPAEALSGETSADFATVPFHLTFQRLMEIVKTAMAGGESLVGALSRLQGEGRRLAFAGGKAPGWTDEQRQLLIALLGIELVNRAGMGSAEIDQLLRKELQERLNTESAGELVAKSLWGPGVSSLFSGVGLWGAEVTSLFSGIGASWSAQPFGGKKAREFFMHVNAEVIFYGGTHPDAKVTIDGREIKLNPDGTFRHHFTFLDGDCDIPIVAQSPDKVETRSATLSFKRATARKGDVGHTAQPERLAKPMGKKKQK